VLIPDVAGMKLLEQAVCAQRATRFGTISTNRNRRDKLNDEGSTG
jgi:hypothetical protein